MPILIIDSSYLIYRSYFAYSGLTFNGQPTGAFFGYVKTTFALAQQYNPSQIIITQDLPSPTWRHQLKPDYKAGRTKPEAEMIAQIPAINDWASKTFENCFSQPGLEADDLIFSSILNLLKINSVENLPSLHLQAPTSKQEIYVFSADKDLYQLLIFPQVKIIKPGLSGSPKLYSQVDFKQQYNIEPFQWLDYKALVGDPSDNLTGVPGIGPKTAISLIQQTFNLQSLFEVLNSQNFSSDSNLTDFNFKRSYFTLNHQQQQLLEDYIKNPKNQNLLSKLISHRDKLQETYNLSCLQTKEDLTISPLPINLLKEAEMLKNYGFNSLINKLEKAQNGAKISAEQLDLQDSLFE